MTFLHVERRAWFQTCVGHTTGQRMSAEDHDPPFTYISHRGAVRSVRELERGAWEHSTPTDLTETPVIINGSRYYPVTEQSTFVVEYTFHDEAYTQVATDVERLPSADGKTSDRRDQTTAAEQTVQITFVTPDGVEVKTVREPAIQSVKPIADPAEYFPVTGKTLRAQAFELEEYAAIHSYAVDPERLITLLNADDQQAVRAAVAGLRHIIDDRPADCLAATHHLRSFLTEPETALARDAVYCLARIAQEAPSDAVIAADELTSYLSHESQTCRENALQAVAAIAEEDPSVVTGVEGALGDSLTARSQTERTAAAQLLARLAAEHPTYVAPFTETLIERLTARAPHTDEKIAVLSALGRLSNHDPAVTIDHIDTIAESLTAESEKVRANAASTLYDLADLYPEAVAQHIDDIAGILPAAETSYAKLNATGALARLATTHPDAVAAYVDQLVPCLYDSRTEVRVNTCWAFQRLGSRAEAAIDALTETALSDTDETVQRRAYYAVDAITDGQSE